MKRYFYIIIGIVIVAAAAIFLIFVLKNKSGGNAISALTGNLLPSASTGSKTGNSAQGGNNHTAANPSSNSSSSTNSATGTAAVFGIAINQPVIGYFVNASNTLFAVTPSGEIIKSANGAVTIMSSSTISNVTSAHFSHNGNMVLVTSGDPGNAKEDVYIFQNKKWVSLPRGMQSPQWSPVDNYLAYFSRSAATGKLILSAINPLNLGRQPETLFSMNATALSLQWVTKNTFIFSDKPSDQANGSIWAFNDNSNTLIPIQYKSQGAESIWGATPTSSIGLIFNDNGQTPSLALIASNGTTIHNLTTVTLPSKCVFSANNKAANTSSSANEYLYCGVPINQNAFTSQPLPDAYNMLALFTNDKIIRINLNTGAQDVLKDSPQEPIDVSHAKIANGFLFFINRYNQKLYALSLPQS